MSVQLRLALAGLGLACLKRAGMLLATLLLLTAGQAGAQNEGEVLPLPLRAEAGKVFAVFYSHSKTDEAGARQADIDAALEILRVYDNGFDAVWTTIRVTVDGQQFTADSPEGPDMFIGVPVAFRADIYGKPVALLDREAYFARLTDNALLAGKTEGERARQATAIDYLRAMSDQELAESTFEVPTYLSLCHGTELIPGQRHDSEAHFPSPFGRGAVRAYVSYLVTEVERTAGTAAVLYQSIMDPKDLKAQVAEMLTSLEPDAEVSALEGMTVERIDAAECQVGLADGWARWMEYERETTAPGRKEKERLSIDVVPFKD